MSKQPARRMLRLVTATVSPPLLYLLLGLHFAAMTLLWLMPPRVDRSIAPMLAVFPGFLWFAVASSLFSMALDTCKLRIPGMRQIQLRTLLQAALITIALPTLVAAHRGDPAFWTFSALLFIPCVIMFFCTSSGYLRFGLLTLYMSLIFFKPLQRSTLLLLQHNNPHAPWWLLSMGGLLLCISAYQWHCASTGMRSILGNGRSIAETLHTNLLRNTLQNPDAIYANNAWWSSPRVSHSAQNSPIARMRTLLGQLFAPSGWQRQFLFLSGLLLPLGILLSFLMRGTEAGDSSSFTIIEGFLSPMIFIILVMVFPQSLNLTYRRNSHDLHELALLPKLGNSEQQFNTLLKAVLVPAFCFNLALLTTICLGESLLLHRPIGIATGLAICALLSLLLQVARMLRTLARGSRIHGWIAIDSLIWSVAALTTLIPMYTVINALNPDKQTSLTTALVVLALFAVPLLLLSWRWYREAAGLPHPFLDRG